MKYPPFLKENGTVGVVAPSFGVSGSPYEERYYDALDKFQKLGFKVVTCEHLYGIKHAKSASAKIRAREFMEMYLNDDIDFVFSVAGGELMLEILPYVNFDKIRKAKPKFFMGLSDNTCLTFTLNTICDVASIYGPCFGGFGMEPWDVALQDALDIIMGKKNYLNSYPKHEVFEETKMEPGHELDGWNLKADVVYKTLDGKDARFSGRLVGGCIDLLTNIVGTRFDHVKEFTERYKDEGIVWYMEACDQTVLDMYRSLWQLKNAGWFENVSGLIMGRALNGAEMFDVDVREAIYNNVKDLNIPVIYDADFGHVPPSWTIINGAIATIKYKNGKCSIKYELR